ncbi:MAG TPA: MmcQ/YjbR family DNA-binding protein [Thermomicrobiales bacterium]|nr:MmcQ/YjbR family DNA-binding protein [Thermomicrobiales bacterium]
MTEHPSSEVDPGIMARMRAISLRLPEAAEAIVFGSPTFQVRAKNFAMLRQEESRTSVWCKAAPGVQEQYLDRDPVRYYRPPYVGPKGWIGAWLDEEIDPDWDDIAEMIETSYRLIAPKRLSRQLES